MTPKCNDCGCDQGYCICLSREYLTEELAKTRKQLAEREKQIVMLEEVLGEIAGSKSLTATPTRFYQHLQRIASDATMTQDLSGLRLCDAEAVGKVSGDRQAGMFIVVSHGTLLYKAREQA